MSGERTHGKFPWTCVGFPQMHSPPSPLWAPGMMLLSLCPCDQSSRQVSSLEIRAAGLAADPSPQHSAAALAPGPWLPDLGVGRGQPWLLPLVTGGDQWG